MIRYVWRKIVSLFIDRYRVTVWFVDDKGFDSSGNVVVMNRSKKVFHFKRLDKVSAKHIKGKSMHDHQIEIKSVEPFNYEIKKIF